MAVRKTLNFLPGIFQTDTNKKFLSATLDQLVSEPNLKNIYGYIGRKFAPTYKLNDSYIVEDTADRQKYQLEPSVVVTDDQQEIVFFASYIDLLNKIKYYGGLTNDHSRLFDNEYYSFEPHISLDKFVNFSQYYWLADGPSSVEISTQGVELVNTYTVIRNTISGQYEFISDNKKFTELVLARGGTYKFVVDQLDVPFWIQSELGIDGQVNATPTISTRDVTGVSNNGEDVGEIIFNVPPKDAQSRFVNMQTVYAADYASPLVYADLHNKFLSQFLEAYPEYAGITGSLNGKTLIFVDTELRVNSGEEAWTAPQVVTPDNIELSGYGEGTVIDDAYRYALWKVVFLDIGYGEPLVRLTPVEQTVQDCLINTAGTSVVFDSNTDTVIKNNHGFNNNDRIRFLSITGSVGIIAEKDYYVINRSVNAFQLSEEIAGSAIIFNSSGSGNLASVVVNTSASFNLFGIYPGAFVQGSGIPAGTKVVSVDSSTRITLSNNVTQSFQGTLTFYGMAPDQKVFIRYGIENANREFYKDYDGFFKRIPILTSLQDELYFQDGALSSLYGTLKIVDPVNWTINVDSEIIGKKSYTSPNGVEFTSGLKVRFNQDVEPQSYQEKEFYIEGVGDSITLVEVDLLIKPEAYNDELVLNYPGEVFPEYVTISRGSKDLNPWTRNNRWFHKDVITKTAEYNNTVVTYDQTLRAQRPIVQFESNLQLFNNGRVGKRHIDVLDTVITNSFKEFEGKSFSPDVNGDVHPYAFGLPLFDGMRVIFAADEDPIVRNKIFLINLVQYAIDLNGAPTGDTYIKLSLADDGDVVANDTLVVASGQYKGSQWWYDGDQWVESQQKTSVFQEPLFDVFDTTGKSLSTYVRSDFAGTRIFGYKRNSAGVADPILGFALSYRNFGTQGDIEFQNYFDTDELTYDENQTVVTAKVSKGVLYKIVDNNTVEIKNNWNTVIEPSRQNQLISYFYGGSDNAFIIDVLPEETEKVPTIKVYHNNVYLKSSQWTLEGNTIVINTTLVTGDKIDILVYSKDTSAIGQYQIPLNLDLNAQNVSLDTLTLGQMRNHLVELSQNSVELVGDILGSSNLRDVELKAQGGNILQHSAPVPYSALFLLDESINFVDALRLAQQEYSKFKNKFLELSATLTGIDPTDPVASVDLILGTINSIKNRTFPWYYSDMVPYGALTNVITYTVFNPLVKSYEISSVFDDHALSNRAVLVYHNDVQLVKDRDYTFDTDRPAVTFTAMVELAVDDVIKFVEYLDTDGNYIPETPTKLGMYPKFVPEIFIDDTYREPISVIRGHDGSITPAFDDYRDQFLLELEKRIFNNIKLAEANTELLWAVVPGKFRNNDYNINEINQLLSKNFLTWIGNNKLDFSTNDTFASNDPFTWNYSRFTDRIDGEALPGSWRACYQYFYDTIRPHLTPWEMLGFSIKPSWWEDYYGPAPYTGGNRLLWEDLEAGRIIDGDRAGIDTRFARPGLTSIIPIDENGILLSPAAILSAAFNSSRAATAWAVGNIGPVEAAWRNSSDYPFAMQMAMALAKPGKYFGLNVDTSEYNTTNLVNQWLTRGDYRHVRQTDIKVNGATVNGVVSRTSGYLNWVADHLVNRGINPSNTINQLLNRYEVKLSYKLAGYSDQKYLQVLAEQSSPSSTNDSIIIPNENYNVHLYKSTPVQRITYSGVIVEKTTNGYTVRGYDLGNPYFTVVPSVVNSNGYKITVLNSEAVVYNDYQAVKLNVPYGYEFKNQQQVVDFFVSYERYLRAQGFVFNVRDEQLGETRDFKLSSREFLFWAQQGWAPGSILVLSPVAETIEVTTAGAIVDTITNYQYGARVLDQNFKLIKNNNYNVTRSATEFKVTLSNDAVVGYFEANLVQYEHVLVFDNTTVFNDIIYKPELGNRQFRLKLIGQKTAEWDGSLYAPGFIYSSGVVAEWLSGKDYFKGELVQYKQQYYVALENVTASIEFDFKLWKQINSSEIQKGLLPNWASIAVKSQSYYDSYGYFNDADQIKYSHGLIGFKPRKYLDDLGLNETTQIELYKGFIKQKGTINAIEELTTAEFNNLKGNIDLYEEWAVRVGEYGALTINPYVEIALDEQAFSINPATARFVNDQNSNQGNGLTVFNASQLYKVTEQFSGTIALNRDANSNYDNDVLTAGYVNIDDVDVTVFDIRDFKDLNDQLTNLSSGSTIWVAKDFTQDWNVYRVTETNNTIVQVSNALDGYITFVSQYPHGLAKDDIFLLKGFSSEFDGFYQAYRIDDLNSVVVEYAGDTTQLSSIDAEGMIFKLDSLRFQYMEDARQYTPLHGWKAGEKIWINQDAATSVVQGQPIDTENNTWKVYEKTIPWSLKQKLEISDTEYSSSSGYGNSVKLSGDGLLAATGIPYAGDGNVVVFSQNFEGAFERLTSLSLNATAVSEMGYSLDIANNLIAVSAPGSYSNIGYVTVFNQPLGTTNFINTQVLVPGNVLTGDYDNGRFGHSIAYDEVGDWMYVGAPGNDIVYVFGLVKNLTVEQETISINNENTLTLSNDITANAGAYITQPNTGANVILLESVSSSNIIKVSSITNIVANAIGAFGNISINSEDANVYVTDTESVSVINSFTLSFDPELEDEPTALAITLNDKIFVPYVDYNLSGNVVTFTANLTQGDYLINQRPCYQLVDTKQGATGSGFGLAIDSSYDGAQLAVGAPYDTVNGKDQAGAVYVYDRVIEAFKGTGQKDFFTSGNIGLVHKVTINDVETDAYNIINDTTIRFVNPPNEGDTIYIETNEFKLLELLTGTVVQAGARFGTSLTICSNNCAIYVGAPYYDNGTSYNTGAVFKFHNRGRLYGTNTGTVLNPVFNIGDTIRLDNFEVEITGTTLADVVDDINSANILGVTAVNANGYLQIRSDKTVAKNLLRILSGSGTSPSGVSRVLDNAGMAVFAEMQIIVSPYNNSGEYFGNRVVLAANAYMLVIGSDRGTTKYVTGFDVHRDLLYPTAAEYVEIDGVLQPNIDFYLLDDASATRDNPTTFDGTATVFIDSVPGSGSTYIYELYDDPRNNVEHPGRYAFAQQLNSKELDIGDGFGAAIDVMADYIVVGAPADDTTLQDAGSVYIFNNLDRTRGWKLIRYQQPTVDIESVNRIYLYDNVSNTILTNMEFVDPAKGKIVGSAEQEITFKTEFDPAIYNRGSREDINLNSSTHWNHMQIDQVWWNLAQVRFLDYEQSSLEYRSINWGRLFPGSQVEVCEWIESQVLPSQYDTTGANGTPKYLDDSAYVEVNYVDPITGVIGSKYYFWVVNRASLTVNNTRRSLTAKSIQDLIENPKAQGIAYAAIIRNDTVQVYNVGKYLSAQNTILHLDHETVKNSSIIHSEYHLIQKGNPIDTIPPKIINKLIDSLAGTDINGAVVPDPNLSVADRYGINIRPRQSMVVDRLGAVATLVDYVNRVMATKPIVRQYDISQLKAQEPEPLSLEQSAEFGQYNERIAVETNLPYIDVANLNAGYKILVAADTSQNGLWVIYELDTNKEWQVNRVQSYKTEIYWNFVDWYADGYSSSDKARYVVNTTVDALKLPYASGDIIKINNTGSGEWQLVLVNADLAFDVIGIQNGTIQLKENLGDFTNSDLGFGNQSYDNVRYDQNPNIELRSIINALRDDIFINELGAEFNNLFFVLVNYLLVEQKYLDWIFKTSFISVTHKLRDLAQYPNYIKDNQTYYQNYIEEVKPYSSKIREYLINYNGSDLFEGSITDFDLPAYYDQDTKIFRSPSGEIQEKDQQLWATGYLNDQLINQDYPQWYNNRNYTIERIDVVDQGSGYSLTPTVTIVANDATGSGATARAVFDFDTGKVTGIVLTNPGTGYSVSPTVVINGGNTRPARAYAILRNDQVRTISTAMKFDRVNYRSIVQDWQPNTLYYKTEFDANGYVISGNVVSFGGVGYTVRSNAISASNFVATDYDVFQAADIKNANDRIMAYYQPQNNMPVRDLKQLVSGVDYPGVQVTGLDFEISPKFPSAAKVSLTLDQAHGLSSGAVGNLIVQPVPVDGMITFDGPITANVGDFITQNVGSIFDPIYVNVTVYGSQLTTIDPEGNLQFAPPANVVAARTIYVTRNDSYEFNDSGNILVNGTEQVIATLDEDDNWSNIGIKPSTISVANVDVILAEITPFALTVTEVVDAYTVEGTINNSADPVWNSNVQVDNIWTSAQPSAVTYITSGEFNPFDSSAFDGVDYDESGTPQNSTKVLDSVISSSYTDSQLGIRAEDIDVDGGAYIDTYSSHAPEELIPGSMTDSLNMQVYTLLGEDEDSDVVAYRIFQRSSTLFDRNIISANFMQIADDFSTKLAAPLYIDDTEIFVEDVSKLGYPNPSASIPGVIFIDGERITYYVRDTVNNKLGQIRRGTLSTPTPNVHLATRPVVDGGVDRYVQGITLGTTVYGPGNSFASTDNISVDVVFSGNITANVGDFITQPTFGANVMVMANAIASSANTLTVTSLTGRLVIAQPISINGVGVANVTVQSISTVGYTGNTGDIAAPNAANVGVYDYAKEVDILEESNLYEIQGAYEVITSSDLATGESDGVVFLRERLGGTIASSIISENLATEDRVNIITESGVYIIEE